MVQQQMMQELQQQQMVQEVVSKLTELAFENCIGRPEHGMGSKEKTCVHATVGVRHSKQHNHRNQPTL